VFLLASAAIFTIGRDVERSQTRPKGEQKVEAPQPEGSKTSDGENRAQTAEKTSQITGKETSKEAGEGTGEGRCRRSRHRLRAGPGLRSVEIEDERPARDVAPLLIDVQPATETEFLVADLRPPFFDGHSTTALPYTETTPPGGPGPGWGRLAQPRPPRRERRGDDRGPAERGASRAWGPSASIAPASPGPAPGPGRRSRTTCARAPRRPGGPAPRGRRRVSARRGGPLRRVPLSRRMLRAVGVRLQQRDSPARQADVLSRRPSSRDARGLAVRGRSSYPQT
jgi:hypothetical protein